MRRRRSCSQRDAPKDGMACLGRISLAFGLLMIELLVVGGGICEAAVASGATQSLSSYRSSSSTTTKGLAFVTSRRHVLPLEYQQQAVQLLSMRGGASSAVAGDEKSEVDDLSDGAEEEDDDEVGASLTASAVKAAIKTKAKQETSKKEASKKAVNAKLQQVPKKVNKKSASFFRVPYIIRALLNPFTVYKMTVAYWASLFNLDYLKKEPALELRSALEEEAKTSGSSGGNTGGANRGKRKMKRGQAKTLNDLPQLSS